MLKDSRDREVINMYEVRSGIYTAAASLAGSQVTSLIPGDADYFLDLVEIMMSNNSTVAVGVNLKNDGSVVRNFQIPAGATIQVDFECPLTQWVKNTPWTLQMDDVTGTTVTVGATVIKNNPS